MDCSWGSDKSSKAHAFRWIPLLQPWAGPHEGKLEIHIHCSRHQNRHPAYLVTWGYWCLFCSFHVGLAFGLFSIAFGSLIIPPAKAVESQETSSVLQAWEALSQADFKRCYSSHLTSVQNNLLCFAFLEFAITVTSYLLRYYDNSFKHSVTD